MYVDEPNAEDSLTILKGLAPKYESYHRCVFPEEVLASAVELSMRYLPDRRLPDKAIGKPGLGWVRRHVGEAQ